MGRREKHPLIFRSQLLRVESLQFVAIETDAVGSDGRNRQELAIYFGIEESQHFQITRIERFIQGGRAATGLDDQSQRMALRKCFRQS